MGAFFEVEVEASMLVAVPPPMDLGIAESPTRDSERWCEATSFSAATATSWVLIMVQSVPATVVIFCRHLPNAW